VIPEKSSMSLAGSRALSCYHVGGGKLYDASGLPVPIAEGNNVFDDVYSTRYHNKTGTGRPDFPEGLGVSASGVVVTGNSTITGTLGVTGNTSITGTLTSSGALTVSSGGAAITGNTAVTGTTTSSGALTVSSGGAAITGNSSITGGLTRNAAALSYTGCAGTPAAPVVVASGGLGGVTTAATTARRGMLEVQITVAAVASTVRFNVTIPLVGVNTATTFVRTHLGFVNPITANRPTVSGCCNLNDELLIQLFNGTTADLVVGTTYDIYWEAIEMA
jgi:hypothetical protein